jgi:hypothetical protein
VSSAFLQDGSEKGLDEMVFLRWRKNREVSNREERAKESKNASPALPHPNCYREGVGCLIEYVTGVNATPEGENGERDQI